MNKKELEKRYEDLIKYDKKVMKLEYIIQKAIQYIKNDYDEENAMLGYSGQFILGDKE